MGQADWTSLANSLTSPQVTAGVTSGIARPNGGGTFVYGISTNEVVTGAVALHNNQVNFAPMSSGGSISAAIKRGTSGGPTNFAPFIYIGLGTADVTTAAYILGLADADPYHIVLRKGNLDDGLQDVTPDPDASPNVLLRSSATFAQDTWHHLRLDMIKQGSGDVILQCYHSDLSIHSVTAPSWVTIPGMEGPQSPTITGFVDDVLGVNTGSAPFTSGRAGFGMRSTDVSRRAFFDHIAVARQV